MSRTEIEAPKPESASRSLVDMVASSTELPLRKPLAVPELTKMIVLGGLFVAVNLWQIEGLLAKWRHNPDWSHGFLIPLFSLYLLYARRSELLSATRRSCLWGLLLMLAGLLGTILGFFPIRMNWFSELSMVLTLLGLVLFVAGPGVIKVAWLPIVYLALAMPMPDRVYDGIALPLQKIAAGFGGALLQVFGVDIQVDALRMRVMSFQGVRHELTVVEACSGVRSLMAFVALSVALAYIEPRPIWQKIVLVLAGIPIAVACNVIRIALTGTMFVIDRPEIGKDIMHEIMGMVLLVPALLLLLAILKFMQWLYVVEDEEEEESQQAAPCDDGGGE
ncbi:MAG: exosortase/archaeosortase family protein [Planctomycetes bacterium]|jgi:exosortase|nr:exosortase/archaeosortase family protein [Planctomycetota bacterium]